MTKEWLSFDRGEICQILQNYRFNKQVTKDGGETQVSSSNLTAFWTWPLGTSN